MNERIQELAWAAEAYADNIVDQGGEFHPAYTQKLAELIVNETADWINDNVGMIDEDARADLLKHFGINRE